MRRMAPHLSVSEDLVGEVREVRFGFDIGSGNVPGLLCLPRDQDAPMPLVFLQHPGMSSKDEYFVRDIALRWALRGWACAGLDAPGHGDRAAHDPLVYLREPDRFPAMRAQFASELTTAVNLLAETYPIDLGRLGYVGYSLGSMLGVPAVAADGRFRAAAFCLVGEGGITGQFSDPGEHLAGLAHTAVRVVGKLQDEYISRAATDGLVAALPGKRDVVWLPGGHFEIGPDVVGAASDWLVAEL